MLDPQASSVGVSSSSEGKNMRHVIKQFDVYKKKFSSTTPEGSMKIDLPGDLQDITIPGKVDEGQLTIS